MTVLDADFNLKSVGSDYAWLHLHQGGRYDATSGLYHFRYRDYSPTLGRWTSLDPIRYAAGDVNLYRALGNSPVNRVDPSGLVWSWLSAAIGAAIGTVIGVGVYVGYNAITGRPITWGGVAGAAAGGAVAGGIAGGFVGAATGDPSALTVIGGGVLIGAGSGAAGGFTGSIVSQGIDQGRIDWGQVAVDTGTGAVIGGVTGGVLGGGKVLLRPRPGVATPDNLLNRVPPEQPPFDPSGTLGAAKAWTMKGRLKHAQLPTTGKIRYVPPKGHPPSQPLPRGPNGGYLDRFGNEWVKGPSRTAGQAFEWDVQIGRNATPGFRALSRDGRHVNVSLDGKVSH